MALPQKNYTPKRILPQNAGKTYLSILKISRKKNCLVSNNLKYVKELKILTLPVYLVRIASKL